MNMQKETRQKALTEIIRSQKIGTQEGLLSALQGIGIRATQASLSRDLNELGIAKENNYYVLHPSSFFHGENLLILSIQSAGPNLLVIKTGSGSAPMVAVGIDEAKLEGVVGTIAGDDTVFVALGNGRKGSAIKKEIIHRFKPKVGH